MTHARGCGPWSHSLRPGGYLWERELACRISLLEDAKLRTWDLSFQTGHYSGCEDPWRLLQEAGASRNWGEQRRPISAPADSPCARASPQLRSHGNLPTHGSFYVIRQGGLGRGRNRHPQPLRGLAQQKFFLVTCMFPVATRRTPVLVAPRGSGGWQLRPNT